MDVPVYFGFCVVDEGFIRFVISVAEREKLCKLEIQ